MGSQVYDSLLWTQPLLLQFQLVNQRNNTILGHLCKGLYIWVLNCWRWEVESVALRRIPIVRMQECQQKRIMIMTNMVSKPHGCRHVVLYLVNEKHAISELQLEEPVCPRFVYFYFTWKQSFIIVFFRFQEFNHSCGNVFLLDARNSQLHVEVFKKPKKLWPTQVAAIHCFTSKL